MRMHEPSFDIFCRVIDNLGDAGVCWRLARRLSAMGHPTRLWIDDPAALARIAPAVQPGTARQHIDGVAIRHWPDSAIEITPHTVVIEAFACSPPDWFIRCMVQHRCLWINLEYLSAESWVESFHGLPSLQPNGLRKTFFFPGFTPRTGGLLREPDLLVQRDTCQAQDRSARLADLLGEPFDELPARTRIVFLFCYPYAPIDGLLRGLARDPQPTLVLSPDEFSYPPQPGGAVEIRRIPYVAQDRFDELLWCCDLNFVRGEDSMVRGLWAGAPMVWQIYRQPESAHLTKLDAWLDQNAPPAAAQSLIRAWNSDDEDRVAQTVTDALAPTVWQAWRRHCQEKSRELASRPDLASQLLRLCTSQLQTR
ncbi:MAG: elongation factor P maturation arginine rhamnosyltransferase EarP [Alcaligenaceae bacterium]|nr:elongation factor P maturation arginine rhamnosyltransferase EarP [Alcaligenaceae bacterium]